MALSQLGEGKRLTNVDTDTSPEAKACVLWLDLAVENVLRDFDWGFARKFASFNLETTNPNPNYAFAYRYPADCLNFRGITTGIRDKTHANTIEFDLGNDDSGGLVFCDVADMTGFYTKKVTNTGFFTPDFVTALAVYLAALIAPSVTSGDPFKMGMKAMQLYPYLISKARANSANEKWTGPPEDSEFILARS